MSPLLATSSGRAHSAAHSSNNGPGDSIRSLCAGVGCAIPSGGLVDNSLQNIQKNHETSKKYQKSTLYKTKRVVKRRKLYKLYEKHQEEVKYKKNIMLSEARARSKMKKNSEHSYSK